MHAVVKGKSSFFPSDGIGEYYAKWKKPDNERQIPYDLTYKWNLINKTNKIEPETWK